MTEALCSLAHIFNVRSKHIAHCQQVQVSMETQSTTVVHIQNTNYNIDTRTRIPETKFQDVGSKLQSNEERWSYN
jgi:hypothetical protein